VARVFSDLGYQLMEVDETTGKHTFLFDLTRRIPQQDVVVVEWRAA